MILGLCCAAGILTAVLIVAFTQSGNWNGSVLQIATAILLAIVCIAGFILLQFVLAWLISLLIEPKKAVLTEKRCLRVYMEAMLVFILQLLRVRCTVTGKEKLPKGRFLLVCNHRSAFDPLVFIAKLRGTKISYISKPENLKLPVAGAFMRRCRFMSIDRENPRNAVVTVNKAAELIRTDECSIGIYPEGTRSKSGELLPFRNGAFKIAFKAKAPIVVAHIWGTECIGRKFPWKRSEVRVDILDVIPAEQLVGSNTAKISEQVREKMLSFEQSLKSVS